MQKTRGEDEEVPLAAQRHHSQPQIAAAQKKPKGKEVSEDVQKLRDIYRMCIVTDHSRQAEEEARKRAARRPSRIVKQNNATFETELINFIPITLCDLQNCKAPQKFGGSPKKRAITQNCNGPKNCYTFIF